MGYSDLRFAVEKVQVMGKIYNGSWGYIDKEGWSDILQDESLKNIKIAVSPTMNV